MCDGHFYIIWLFLQVEYGKEYESKIALDMPIFIFFLQVLAVLHAPNALPDVHIV